MPIKLISFGISDIGLVRSNNEDVWAALEDKQFYILADGMGGHKAGEVASFSALHTMCKAVHALPTELEVEEACRRLREAVAAANTKVFKEARERPECSGMGTTLSCFMIVGSALVYAHIGDSRLYRYREKLEQLTQDHSLRTAPETCKEAKPAKSGRHVITRAIGTHSVLLPDLGVTPVISKDIYILCSDGLSDYVEEKRIEEILREPLSLKEMGEKLVQTALKKGGNDNITVLLVQVAP